MCLSVALLLLPLLIAQLQLPTATLAASLSQDARTSYYGYDSMARVVPMVNGPRSVRQANLQGTIRNNGTVQAEGTLKSMASGELEKEVKAKAEAGGKFGFGLGLSGLTLTGDVKADGGVDSKTKVKGAAEVESTAEGQVEGEGQNSGKGGLLFPNVLSLIRALGR